MKDYAILKGVSYVLCHTPSMILQCGSTQTTEKIVNPDSDYLKQVNENLRSFDEVVSYLPNQIYIGNKCSDDLRELEFPWYNKPLSDAGRLGKFGEIFPEDEFIAFMKICDVFDLVKLESNFSNKIQETLKKNGLFRAEYFEKLNGGEDISEIKRLINDENGEPLFDNGELVGVVKKAHDIDINLSSHVILENLVSKASSVLSLLYLIKNTGISCNKVDYVIDCSEEACGDMNQRGGGNFAKACAEIAGFVNATGSDVRGFCAAPVHAILNAASLVKAGTFKNVVVTAGGCTAKLGMNGKDHVKKGIPLLEDCVASFSVLISENHGVSAVIRNDIVGSHKVGTGSSPQAVITSLVTEPLDKQNLKITDVDKYSPELQNPDITKPAGAGDVPESNYKMIAALGVKRGEIQKNEILDFVKKHGMIGWAPTQGHIPSGVPYLGFARESILNGEIQRAMIIGKGSLFLGRMTNLFDGVSFIIEKNNSVDEISAINKVEEQNLKNDENILKKSFDGKISIGIAVSQSENGVNDINRGIEISRRKGFNAFLIDGENSHEKMKSMIQEGNIHGAVTMHYHFSVGVSTVGRIITPGFGKEVFISSTTGISSTNRVEAMIRNAIHGIIAAKSCGINNPTVGIINIEGARQVEKALLKLKSGGYDINFSTSSRSDGGFVMRGNDLLNGSADVMVMDSLTGNLMMKIFSAYTTGGNYESLGYGYGPGIFEDMDKLIMIISRASGAPVVSGAIEYANDLINGGIFDICKNEYDKAKKAALLEIIEEFKGKKDLEKNQSIVVPKKEVVTYEIHGIEVYDLDDAKDLLCSNGIYAETGMGCTGPVILVSEKNSERAKEIINQKF